MSLLICLCSIHKWHFKDRTDSGTYNATECNSIRLCRDLRFNVTAVWQTVSKHQFHCALQCVVNSTESSTDPQSANCDGGTSNSTAAATFVLQKTWDDRFSPPLSHPSPLLIPEWLFYPSARQSLQSRSHVYSICRHKHAYAHASTPTAFLHFDMSLPVTVSCTGNEHSHPPMCAVSVPTHDRSHCVQLYEYSLKCQTDCVSVSVNSIPTGVRKRLHISRALGTPYCI